MIYWNFIVHCHLKLVYVITCSCVLNFEVCFTHDWGQTSPVTWATESWNLPASVPSIICGKWCGQWCLPEGYRKPLIWRWEEITAWNVMYIPETVDSEFVDCGCLSSDMLTVTCLLHRSVIAFVSQLRAQSGECSLLRQWVVIVVTLPL